jgi:hypothetical protein
MPLVQSRARTRPDNRRQVILVGQSGRYVPTRARAEVLQVPHRVLVLSSAHPTFGTVPCLLRGGGGSFDGERELALPCSWSHQRGLLKISYPAQPTQRLSQRSSAKPPQPFSPSSSSLTCANSGRYGSRLGFGRLSCWA